jgi:hypothetical protein
VRVAAFPGFTKLGRVPLLGDVVGTSVATGGTVVAGRPDPAPGRLGATVVVVVVVVATGVVDVALEAAPVPTALVAVTDTEYDVPLSNPVITHDVDDVVHVEPDAVDAVYPVITEPPSLDGAVHDTVNCVSPATNATDVDAPGTVTGVPDTELDDGLVP